MKISCESWAEFFGSIVVSHINHRTSILSPIILWNLWGILCVKNSLRRNCASWEEIMLFFWGQYEMYTKQSMNTLLYLSKKYIFYMRLSKPHDNLFTCRMKWQNHVTREKKIVNINLLKLLFRSWCLNSPNQKTCYHAYDCCQKLHFVLISTSNTPKTAGNTNKIKWHGFSSCYWKDIRFFFVVLFSCAIWVSCSSDVASNLVQAAMMVSMCLCVCRDKSSWKCCHICMWWL